MKPKYQTSGKPECQSGMGALRRAWYRDADDLCYWENLRRGKITW